MAALTAALSDEGIDSIEFDGPIADIYGAVFPRRLMVLDEDLIAAQRIAREICPEQLQ